MISLLLIIIFFTFYTFYATTERIKVSSSLGIEKKLQNHKIKAKTIGIVLFISSFILAIYKLGFAVGILFNVIGFMTLGGLIILLAPLQLINYKNICIISLIFLLIELFQQLSSF
ncbi:hypothetical protein [Wenyingzhuangia sp. IMCC45467]